MKSTLTDQNFPNVSDESMDVDPNYDPSDFLAMHKPRQNLGEPSSLQGAFTNFLSHAQDDSGPYNAPEASTSAASGMGMSFPSQEDDSLALQMPSEMPTNTMNNGMGIDDDLDISESDEEDDGSRVRIKKEVFDDGDYALQHHQQMGQQSQSQSQIYLVDSSNEPTNYSKTNAAGWLPSSGSRTAGAFSQPGKTSLPVGNSSGSSKQGSAASSKKAQQK